jgi:hypothetical protein
MAHYNTVFSQLLKLIPRHEFETLAKQHHSGRSFRSASRWSQFVTMAMGQLSGRNSLRDIVENISAQAHRLYHLGSAKLTRSDLSRIAVTTCYVSTTTIGLTLMSLFGQMRRPDEIVITDDGSSDASTRFRRFAHVIEARFSAGVWSFRPSTFFPLPRFAGVTSARYLLLGANTP